MNFIAGYSLIFELIFSVFGCIGVYGMHKASKNIQCGIDEEWTVLNVVLGAIVGLVLSVPVLFIWHFKFWWLHIPLTICLIRTLIIMRWNK